MSRTDSAQVFAFIGSYAELTDPSVYVCRFDAATGKLDLIQSVDGLQNPSFLTVDADNRKLYAITEIDDGAGTTDGAIAAFRFDPDTAALSPLNQKPTVAAPSCHINVDHTKRWLTVASFRAGLVGLSAIAEDGQVGELCDVHQHEGSSILPVQNQPHPHSVIMDPANRFAIVPDLGLDLLHLYRLDAAAGKLVPHGTARTAPGSGPRHFSFHPELPFGYLINELNGTIDVFAYDTEQGTLVGIQTVSTLPESYTGENTCADIHISPDGQFLYGSNRGHDSIAIYRIERSSGRLTFIEHCSTLGEHPRNFALSPDGRFLLVANRDTNNIVAFSRNEETGTLTAAGISFMCSQPVCIKFAIFA